MVNMKMVLEVIVITLLAVGGINILFLFTVVIANYLKGEVGQKGKKTSLFSRKTQVFIVVLALSLSLVYILLKYQA